MISICIPTYNREKFLGWTLNRLLKDFPEADIVVSDDASTDSTFWLCNDGPVWWPSDYPRYSKQPHNLGIFPNLRAALNEGTEKYVVYCADDDYLLPEGIEAGIAYLEAHPEVSAYFAPCEIWNEVEKHAYWNAYKCESRTFAWEDGIELFNFLISQHVWPEHAIYRTPLPLSPLTRAYWAFTDLADLLAAGTVHFEPKPFYRNVLVHPVGERVQAGNVQCLTYFDEYRAGLEVLAFSLFGRQPIKARRQIQDLIGAFICQRFHNASVLYDRAGHARDAEMLRKRIAIADPSPEAA